jgi:hypothetical protein
MNHVQLILRRTEKDAAETCTKEAAAKRQELIEQQKAEFLAKKGNKIEKLPDVGEKSRYKVKRNF